VKCVVCGNDVSVGDRFCSACGAPVELEGTGIEHTGAITSIITNSGTGPVNMSSGIYRDLPSGAAMLVVHRGPGEGTEYSLSPLNDVVVVGRAPEAEVFLDDVTVSRHHAEFRHGSAGWSVRDVGSLNGTYVNRVRVEDQQLRGGDEVQIGKFRFIFLVGVEG
jgi:pSer/pThr/pTyr-binding forkhead associated (FHA) protein